MAENTQDSPPLLTDAGQQYFPVDIESLEGTSRNLDLFLKHGSSQSLTLYRERDVAFTEEDRMRLREQGTPFVYIPMDQHVVYRRSLISRLDEIFKDTGQDVRERARTIRTTTARMIEDVLAFPGEREPIEGVLEISKLFSGWCERSPDDFSYLLDMTYHDYYTATHMLNVSIGCGLLMREMRPEEPVLAAVAIQGGLLHDIGKRDIPSEILTKEGPLDPEEWKLVRRHPATGFEELSANPSIPPAVLEMVRDHHERLDGKGYPAGKLGKSVGLFARICAVVDVFDAITSNRPYRDPIPPINAVKLMRSGAESHFDPKVLEHWSKLIQRLIKADPDRAPAPLEHQPEIPIQTLQQQPPLEDVTEEEPAPDERREHKRFAGVLPATGVFLLQGKTSSRVKEGQRFRLETVDFSRGGMQIRTAWPLSLGDLLCIEVHVKEDQSLKKVGRVVRVRSDGQGRWLAGMRFVEEQSAAA